MPAKRKIANDARSTSAKIAPAVGLLLFGEHALASVDPVTDIDDAFSVPEPSTLALLAVGAAAAGIAHAVKNRRKK